MERNRQLVLVLAAGLGALLCGLAVMQPGTAQERVASVEHGGLVYSEFCAACHNRLEKVGSYLVDDSSYFLNAGVPPQALGMLFRHPVRVRPEGSRMPAYAPEEVSDADLDDVGLYLASLAPPPPETPPTLGTAERGAGPYAQFCGSCHGARGEGVGHMLPLAVFANQLKQAKAPPHVMLGFVMLSARSGSVPNMPTFAPDKLSDAALTDIAAHIWAMPMPPPPPAE